ncbi:Porin domain-containing protein [Comamonas aquatilis]|uniref:porin n=1 Tax=Comamonas aquatilis TaxID=1778406 RepID=UPI0039EF2A4A
MKNITISLASGAVVATACMGASAQTSSVQIYGVADMGFAHISNKGGSSLNAVTSGRLQSSRIGFKGNEDLGGGLSAVFTLESGIEMDTGTSTSSTIFFNRQAWVGLKSTQLGTLTLGRQYSPIYDHLVLSSGAPTFGLVGGAVDGIAIPGSSVGRFDNTIGGSRTDNSIKYTSPNLGGFTATAMVGLGEVAGDNAAGRTLSAGVGYAQGPVNAAVTYLERECKTSGGCTGAEAKDKILAVVGGYNFGFMHLGAIYTQQRNAKNVKDVDGDVMSVRAVFPVNAWRLSAGYQVLNDKSARNQDVRQFNLGATYDLSKRSTLYAFYTNQKVSNGGIASMGLLNSSNSRQNQWSVGMRHTF